MALLIISAVITYFLGVMSWCQIIGLNQAKKYIDSEERLLRGDEYKDFEAAADQYLNDHRGVKLFHIILIVAIFFISFVALPVAAFLGCIVGYTLSLIVCERKRPELLEEFIENIGAKLDTVRRARERSQQRYDPPMLNQPKAEHITVKVKTPEPDNREAETVPKKKRFCRHCGAEITHDGKYCSQCGTEII